MMFAKRFIAAACAALTLAGQVVAAEAVGQFAPPPLLLIGPGDQVKVEVFDNPEMNTTTNVSDNGSIRLPLLAEPVVVSGKSPAEAAQRIEAAYKAGQFLLEPHVTLTVLQTLSQRVSVTGEVNTPNLYPIQSNSTVLDLIALAGGITKQGGDVVYILRPDASGRLQRIEVDLRRIVNSRDSSAAAIQTLRGGDAIYVPKWTFTIIGEVNNKGEYRIEGDMTLYEAVARAGGPTALGSSRPSRWEVRRKGDNDKYVELKGKKDLRIQPGDVILVKESFF